MQSLRENPFRLLGLLSSSSSREIDSRSKKLRQYLEAGVEPNVNPDYYCPTLGRKPMRRLPESIEQVRGMLTLDQDKLLYALLWFVQMNEVTDPVALEALAQGDLAEAERIWRQQVYAADGSLRAITDRNSSAYHNLSVYLLCSAQSADIVTGVKLGLMALEQGSVLSFLQEKLGVSSMSLQDVELLYLNRLISDIQKRPRGGLPQLMDLLGHQEYTAKKALMKSYALEAVKTLEETIERSVHQSKTVAGAGLAEGEKLLREGGEMLQQIAVSLPKNDPKYERASNALAKGVKSCGEGYFEDCSEQDDFASQRLLELYRKTQTFACSDFVSKELDSKIKKLQEWVQDAPMKREEAKVKVQVEELLKLSNKMMHLEQDTLSNVNRFVTDSEVLLSQIQHELGADSLVYQRYCTIVARVAMNSLVAIVNGTQRTDRFPWYNLKEVLAEAWKLVVRLDALELERSFRYGYFRNNRQTLSRLCSELKVFWIFAMVRAELMDWKDAMGEVRYRASELPPFPASTSANLQDKGVWDCIAYTVKYARAIIGYSLGSLFDIVVTTIGLCWSVAKFATVAIFILGFVGALIVGFIQWIFK